MASPTAAAEVNDGPVLSFMNKRLRALRKKYNRIVQMEEALAQGKSLNKEQEEVLRSKTAVCVLIDEYEKLRQPLSAAVLEEISLARASAPLPPPPYPDSSSEQFSSSSDPAAIEDLLKLLYFGSLFDVKPQSEFASTMLTRTHERECCLTYDYVTDEVTDLLGERDLDLISALGGLLIARSPHSTLSHKDALQSCVEHAKRWLSNSDQAIQLGADVTYAELRERLNKILASDYFTTTPEMKATEYMAAAAGKYSVCQVLVSDHAEAESNVQEEGESDGYYQQKEEEITNFQMTEPRVDQPTMEGPQEDASETLYPEEDYDTQEEQSKPQTDMDELNENEGAGSKGYALRRGYYNQRGGGRGGGGGRRGYPNGRGGRGGRGGGSGSFQNGRSQSYDYYQRNYYNPKSRGGGRSGGMGMYSNHGGTTFSGYRNGSDEVVEDRS